MELIALLGGIWFLVFIGFIFIVGVIASEIDNFALGTATFVVALIGAQTLFDVPVWATISDNPLSLVLFLAAFIVVGAIYTAVWRWPEFIRDNSKTINADYVYCNKNKTDKVSFDEYLNSSYYSFTASKHKDRLATWIITWPFSMVWELSRKPIKYTYKLVYSVVGAAFENIGTSVARRIHERNKQ